MAPRVPPSVVVSVGDASNSTKGRVLTQLDPKVSQCLFTVQFAYPCAYPSAFIDELKAGIAFAGNSLPSTVPGIQLIFVVESAREIQAVREAVRLMWSCGSWDVAVFPLVLCLDPAVSPRELIFPGVRSFLLPKCWRGACLQGPAKRIAGEALLLTFVATQASRVPASRFECFDRTRFDHHDGVLLAAIDRYALPDFDRESERLLMQAVASNYVPEVSPQARVSAVSRGVDQPELILRSNKPKRLLEIEDAEKVLCSALADSSTVDQAAAVLGSWTVVATGDAISFLRDLEVALLRWKTELEAISVNQWNGGAARPILDSQCLPPISRLGLHARFASSEASWKRSEQIFLEKLLSDERNEIDRDYYSVISHLLSPRERLARVEQLAGITEQTSECRITRHFPERLCRDEREEILAAPNVATNLYLTKFHVT